MTTGLEEITKNLSAEIKKIEGNTFKGMRKVGLLIEGDAVERTPVDTSVLRLSSFSDTEITDNGFTTRVGYTAKYAPWVHEFPMKLKGKPRAHFGRTGTQSKFGPQQRIEFGGGSLSGVFWQGGENKFLEKAIKENQSQILSIIKSEADIK